MNQFKQDQLEIWTAFASPGEPICILGEDFTEQGYSINLYLDGDGAIAGVEIWKFDDEGDLNIVSVVGDIPQERLDEMPEIEEALPSSVGEGEGVHGPEVEIWTRTETGLFTQDGKSFEYETTYTAV